MQTETVRGDHERVAIEQSVVTRAVEWLKDAIKHCQQSSESGFSASQAVDRFSARAVAKHLDAELRRYQALDWSRLSFGSLSLAPADLDVAEAEEYRVGVQHIDLDDVTIIDFRAPIAAAFYQNQLPAGQTGLRVVERASNIVSGLKVEAVSIDRPTQSMKILSPSLAAIVPAPTGQASRVEGARSQVEEIQRLERGLRNREQVVRDIEQRRDGRLAQAAATIQADQDIAIRAPVGAPLVIDGGPGTGKTLVGLHRVAQLLYDRPNSTEPVLLIGPTEKFSKYVSKVLPSLGEAGRNTYRIIDLETLCLEGADLAAKGAPSEPDPEKAALKSGAAMAKSLRETLWTLLQPKSLLLKVEGGEFLMSTSQVQSMLEVLRIPILEGTMSYAACRDKLRSALMERVLEWIKDRPRRANDAQNDPSSTRVHTISDPREAANYVEVANAILPTVTPTALVRKMLAATEREPQWTAEDIPLLAEAQYVLAGQPQKYAHVLVDEAQNLSEMQWLAVRRRLTGGGITIIGDANQRTSANAIRSWPEVLHFLGVNEASAMRLDVSYRVTKQTLKYASRALARGVSGNTPVGLRKGEKVYERRLKGRIEPEDVEAIFGRSDDNFVGVITVDNRFHRLTANDNHGGPWGNAQIVDPEMCRGLEFDWAIVVEPAAWCDESEEQYQRLFVALTRATKRLFVLHSSDLPARLQTH